MARGETAPDSAASPDSSGSGRRGLAWSRQDRRGAALMSGLLAIGALLLIQDLRPGLLVEYSRAKDRHDAYVLPNQQHMVLMSFGYRSAVADLMFAHLLVASGLHLAEKRRFETAGAYLETINELDPKFATPYRFADTILTVQSVKPTLDDYVSARRILERGMQELPYDLNLWLSAGQFMAYLAPPHVAQLAGEVAAKEWRQQGARRLARSCELVGKDENTPHHCVTAAGLLSQDGELQALGQFAERVVAANDDPAVQELALASLAKMLGKAQGEEHRRKIVSRRERLERLRARGLGFVTKDQFLILGPAFDAYECLDPGSTARLDCATSLAEYHHRSDELDVAGSRSTPP